MVFYFLMVFFNDMNFSFLISTFRENPLGTFSCFYQKSTNSFSQKNEIIHSLLIEFRTNYAYRKKRNPSESNEIFHKKRI